MNKVMIKMVVLIAIASLSVANALPPKVASEQAKAVVFHNANIHVGNGEILKNATIAFDKGKIVRVGYFRMAWQKSDIDLKGKHVYPGLILPTTALGLQEISAVKATSDQQETGQNNANVRSIIAYNTDSELIPTLRFNGILLAQTTPQGGLISGLSSVVQLDAWNWEDAAVMTDDAVHVNWPSTQKTKFDFSTFTAKKIVNKNYASELAEIKSLFNAARSKQTVNETKAINLKIDAITPVYAGSRQVFIHVSDSKSIIESIEYFQSSGIEKLVLVAGQEVVPVLDFIKHSKVPVIVKSTHDLPDRSDASVDSGYTTAIKLHQAGILVALANPSIMSSRNLAFTAGTLVSYGLEHEQALKMVTANTAKILGIDDNYGTLQQGKSATLIITTGDVLDMRGNIIEDAYIDGRKIDLNGRQQELNQRYSEKYGF
jgi:imidazolonepropionase-like amidohydrolase